MKMKHAPLAIAMVAGAAAGADTPLKDAKLRFGHSATRATANFRVADTIEARLGEQGMSLHAQLIATRLRIEAALDQAQAALDKGDLETVNETLKRAEALLDRFARQIGGD